MGGPGGLALACCRSRVRRKLSTGLQTFKKKSCEHRNCVNLNIRNTITEKKTLSPPTGFPFTSNQMKKICRLTVVVSNGSILNLFTFFDVVFFQCLGRTIYSVLLHFFGHIRIFNHGFTIRHLGKIIIFFTIFFNKLMLPDERIRWETFPAVV